MLWFLFWFGLALGAKSPSEDNEVKLERGSCPMFWYSFNNRCYKYVASEMTWADAELHCLSEGANLVSIHSQNEENFVKSLIVNFDPIVGPTWFGLNDLYKEGTWMWSDGCAVKFTNWESGQPNGGDSQKCGQLYYSPAWNWNDYECHTLSPFVCATRITCP